MSMTDDQLNALFAEKVAGFTYVTFPNGVCPNAKHWKNANGEAVSIHWPRHNFTQSLDAVLPWLQKQFDVIISGGEGQSWAVTIHFKDKRTDPFTVCSDYLPRACVLALLKAHGVEVGL